MILHLITRQINGRSHFWNTCGWTERAYTARLYTRADARNTLDRMKADGVQAKILRWA
jgi:hypothetical protein